MANVTTIDKTPNTGSATFPLQANEFYGLVETIASQNIRNAISTNRIVDGFYNYDVTDGSVLEEAVIEMAKKQVFTNTGAPDFKPVDPVLHVKYFNNWEKEQFVTTTRLTDIRNVIANKGVGFEDFVARIIDSLTQQEANTDYRHMADILNETHGADFSMNLEGKVPASAKGVIYCAREMYNALKATNDEGGVPYAYGVPVEDIRIAIGESTLNLLDVTELANVFNLTKEELFGKMVVVPYGDLVSKIMVYDVRAFGRGTRLEMFTQDNIGKGLYTNHYLTTDRIYLYNDIFKCVYIDASKAIDAEKAKLLVAKGA